MTSEASFIIGRIVCSLASETLVSAELKWAIAVAGHFDATLDVLQIRDAADGVKELKYIAFEDHSRRLMNSLDSYQRFDQLVQAAGASIRVATFRADGPAVAAILQHAERSCSDLVILSSSQAVSSISQSPSDIGRAIGEMVGCALLTVQRGDPPPCFRRILLPVDFTAATSAAVEWAVAFATRFGSEIHLLHVVPASPPEPETADPTSVISLDATLASANARLSEIETALRERGVAASSAALSHDDTVRAIVECYADGAFDLILMGLNNQGRSRSGVIARIRQNNDVSLLSVGRVTPHAEFVRGRSSEEDEEFRASRVHATG